MAAMSHVSKVKKRIQSKKEKKKSENGISMENVTNKMAFRVKV